MTNSLIQSYEKARSGCALFHLKDWAVFRLSGKDTRDYLNRISTANIKICAPGEGVQTLFLQADGRMVADCAVLCKSEGVFHVICPASCGENLALQLDRFLFAEKVVIEDLTAHYYTAMISGPGRLDLLEAFNKVCLVSGVDIESADVNFAPAAARTIVLITEQGFNAVSTSLYGALKQRGGFIGDDDLYEVLRIEDGCPAFGKDTSVKTIPLEANQKPAISFTKGCFPGQEIVARMNNLGHPANVLVGLLLPETSDEWIGQELAVGDRRIGKITSVCYSPALKASLGLGYVKWNYREAGQRVKVSGQNNFEAVVVTLPLSRKDL